MVFISLFYHHTANETFTILAVTSPSQEKTFALKHIVNVESYIGNLMVGCSVLISSLTSYNITLQGL